MAKKKAKKKVNKATGRDYSYDKDYAAKPEQKKNRAARNKTRREAIKDGRVAKGDGKDMHHVDGNPRNTAKKNTRVTTKKANRSKK